MQIGQPLDQGEQVMFAATGGFIERVAGGGGLGAVTGADRPRGLAIDQQGRRLTSTSPYWLEKVSDPP